MRLHARAQPHHEGKEIVRTMRHFGGLRILSSVVALALAAASTASAGRVDLEALRLFLDREDALYRIDEEATLTLAYEVHGDPGELKNILVDVVLQQGGQGVNLRFRLKKAKVPQVEHHFHMPLDLEKLRLSPGSYQVTARLDSKEDVREMNEANNSASTTLALRSPATRVAAGPPRETHRIPPEQVMTVDLGEGGEEGRSWEFPLEVGFHPAYEWSAAVLRFPNPARLVGPGEEVAWMTLELAAETIGRPFEELAPLEAWIRPVPSHLLADPDDLCRPLKPARVPIPAFEGRTEVELAGRVPWIRPGERPSSCQTVLEVRLLFGPSHLRDNRGRFLHLDEQATVLVVGIRDRSR
jgi:hypothetical protein